jgi:hypothetical protein
MAGCDNNSTVKCYLLSTVLKDKIPENKEGVLYRVASKSDKTREYIIRWSDLLGRYTCDCPDWVYRRMYVGTDCKHIKEYLETIE